MRILNNGEFSEFLQTLNERELEQHEVNEGELDLLEYYWLLVSILEGLDNPSVLEILKDSTGDSERYKIIEASIDDVRTNRLCLRLQNTENQLIEEQCFDIVKCDDARVSLPYLRKYYVYTENDMYRFLIILTDR